MNSATATEYRPDGAALDDFFASASAACPTMHSRERLVWRWIFGSVAALALAALLFAVPIVASAASAAFAESAAGVMVVVLSAILAIALVVVIVVAAASALALRCASAAKHLAQRLVEAVVHALPIARRTRDQFQGVRMP